MRFAGSAREAFESLDLDRDGKLSQQDLQEGLKKVRAFTPRSYLIGLVLVLLNY